MPPHSYFPLRWESTGEQWWYASPIDCAAAYGHYDLVRELLHIDPNLLIKLTSLRRIRRLETVWDDQSQFNDVAKSRAYVARNLLLGCESKDGREKKQQKKKAAKEDKNNSLIRAGYGGWFLYTAASAGDLEFVKDLLERDPFLVFGEGEYGITDILYAAARSKCCEVFRILIDFALSLGNGGGRAGEEDGGGDSEFKWEMMNRGVHAAARGGNLVVLKELLSDCGDDNNAVLAYRDALGSSILHVASARGQVEVVKYLIAAYDITHSVDNRGNTALHVAAYKGHLPVVEALVTASPILASNKNDEGDTFLHMAISGFRAPGFHRIDQQIDLMKQLTSGRIIDMKHIINIRNKDGRTALHVSVADNIRSEVVELLISVPSVDLNARDVHGMTPLDLLKEWPETSPSKILIKRLVAAGGMVSGRLDNEARDAHVKLPGIGGTSPGSSFRVPDAELFLYADDKNSDDASEASCDRETAASPDFGYCPSELSRLDSSGSRVNSSDVKKSSPVNKLKVLFQWTKGKESRTLGAKLKLREDDDDDDDGGDYAFGLYKITKSLDETPTPLRQRFSTSVASSLPNNKRLLPMKYDLPSPTTKKKFTESLSHGVIQALMPRSPLSGGHSPSSPFSRSSFFSPSSMARRGIEEAGEYSGAGMSRTKQHHRQGSFRKMMMNQYFCFGAEGLASEDSINCRRPSNITRSTSHA